MLLPPPHATGRIVVTISKRHSVHILRRLLSKSTRTKPTIPIGSNVAWSRVVALNNCGVSAAERLVAFTVSVALPPGVTELGETPHAGIVARPLTEQVSAIVPEKPPCAAKVSVSVVCEPRLTIKLAAAGLSVKSGAGLKIAATD